MTSRERFIKAINHQETDRPPIDLGSTSVTGIAASTLSKLRDALGLEKRHVIIEEPFQLLGRVEEDVRQALNVDVIGLWGETTIYGFKNRNFKPWKLPEGTDVLVSGDFNITVDEEGNTYLFPQGDTNVPPSAKMPKNGNFFDCIVRQQPFDENKNNAREDFKEDYKLFSEEELRYLEKQADYYYNNTEYGIIGSVAGAGPGIGDAAYIPGPGVKVTPGIRSVEEWFIAHIEYPNYVKEKYAFQTEIALKNLQLYKQAVGEKIQAIFLCGTDFGSQKNSLISRDMFVEFYKPYLKQMNDWVKKNTNWKIFYHSCGSIINLLDEFVEIGVDILNPVQCSACGMDPVVLKEKYGDKLTFWGGAVDTQNVLPFGTPEEVEKHVAERVKIFSKGGGFVFSTIHNILAGTPVENLLAMYRVISNIKTNISRI